jgi:hypothetical protein
LGENVELVKIEDDRVTIELDPRDCWWLAEACEAAHAYLFGDSALARYSGYGGPGEWEVDDEPRLAWHNGLAAALKAAMVAAENEYLAGGDYHPTLDYVRRRYSGKGERFPKEAPDELAEGAPLAA